MSPGMGRALLFHLALQVHLWPQLLGNQHLNPWGALQRPKSLKGISVLPNDVQMTGFVSLQTPARYFFAVMKSPSPVTVQVTPCESPISWRLSFLQMPSDTLRGGAEDAEHLNSPDQARTAPLEVFSYQGNGEELYHTATSPAGLYRLDIFSMEKDTKFQLFASSSADSQGHLPQLPPDLRVDVVSVTEREVTLAWNLSPGVPRSGIEYCAFVNRLHNFRTLCAIEASSLERNSKPSPRDKVRWGLNEVWLENNARKHNGIASSGGHHFENALKSLENENEVLREDPGARWAVTGKGDSQRICVSNQANVTMSGLRPATHYYFDVFAVHRGTGTSAAYTGTFAETKSKEKHRSSELKAEEMADIFLRSRAIKILRFPVGSFNGSISLFIHSCLHKTHLDITLGHKTVVSQSIEGAQLFQFSVSREEVCTIRLKANHKGPSLIKLLLTHRPQNLPFTSLPTDTGLRVSDHSHACASITVSWTGTWQASKYCIYMRRIEEGLDLHLIKKHQNSCLGPDARPKSEVVACRRFQGSDHQRTTTIEKIKGLKPGKVYLMDVYMFGQNNYTLKYPSRIVKIRKC